MPEPPHDKVALVTGSGKRRVGNAIATALAARGYAVALHYRRSADEAQQSLAALRALGVRAAAFAADVADETAVARMFQQVMKTFGRLDVLVTAAAVWERGRWRRPAPTTCGGRSTSTPWARCCVASRRAGSWSASRKGRDRDHRRLGLCAALRRLCGLFPQQGGDSHADSPAGGRAGRANRAVRVNCILPGPVMLPDDLPTPR